MSEKHPSKGTHQDATRRRVEPVPRAGVGQNLRRTLQRMRLSTEVLGELGDLLDDYEHQSRLQLALEAGQVSIWEMDLLTGRLIWSKRMHEMLGVPEGDPLDKDLFFTRVHPEDRQAVQEQIEHALQESRWLRMEFRVVTPQDEVHWLQTRARLIRDEEGQPVRMVGATTNIDDRKAVEQQLSLKNQHIEGLFEHAPVGLVLFAAEPPFRVQAHNRLYQQMFPEPWRSQGMQGKAITDYAPMAEEGGILEVFRTVAQTGEACTLREFAYDGLPGGRRWFNWHLSAVKADGRVVALAHSVVEVTELVQTRDNLEGQVAHRTDQLQAANAELRSNRDLLETVFNNIPVMLAFYGSSGKIPFVNHEFERLTGWTSEEVARMAEPMKVFYPDPETRTQVWDYMVSLDAGWKEWPVTTKDGQILLSSWANVELSDGSCIGIGLDVRDEREAAAKLRKLNDELSKRAQHLQRLTLELTDAEQRERRRLAQYLHDNLQQLLVAAKMRLEILQRKTQDNETREAVSDARDLIVEGIQASRSLTFDLSPPVLYDHGLCAALEWLKEQMLEKHNFHVTVHTSGQDGSLCESIKVFLFTAIRELLFNVRKHSGIDSARVELACEADHVHVVVMDHGKGFDLRILEENDAKSKAGFGLFSIQERIELLGGRIEIHSAPAEGSRFALRVPVETEGLAPAEQVVLGVPPERLQDQPASLAGPLGILIVDDHEVVRDGVACILRDAPDMAVVGEAADGDQAVEMAMRLRPDRIVMDLSMSGMDGIKAMRIIKKRLPEVRIVMLTMSDSEEVAERARQAGADAFVSKATASEKLLAAIRGEQDG